MTKIRRAWLVLPVLLAKPETPPPPPLVVAVEPVLPTAVPELDTSRLQAANSDSAEAPSSTRWNDGIDPVSPKLHELQYDRIEGNK